jgi:hypothetical protein
MERNNKSQQAAMLEVLNALARALKAGVDPDFLMRCIIRKGIEVVRADDHVESFPNARDGVA